ncbi:MAG: GNAT family N-acetyltransferase [Candidatus Hydrogenedentes bacterium]|nr:GNAT family N-acetyltransferase [Candidatus Hydrogenedentota bacterium]
MHVIETDRLRLQLVDMVLFDFCLEGKRIEAERYSGVEFDDEWMRDAARLERRRNQLMEDAGFAPWCVRMVVLKSTSRVIGQIGFHTPPDPPGLRDVAPGGIEFGYRIYDGYRRQGYAKESAMGMMRWAVTEFGIPSFVLSISPGNFASQALAKSLGFVKASEQIDEVDGLEDVLVLQGATLAHALAI